MGGKIKTNKTKNIVETFIVNDPCFYFVEMKPQHLL